MLYGYLTVALEHEVEGPDRMEIIFDRRRPAAPPGDPPLGVGRRTHPAVDWGCADPGLRDSRRERQRGRSSEASSVTRGLLVVEVRGWTGGRASPMGIAGPPDDPERGEAGMNLDRFDLA